jgi:iron(III) transport system ATP-binding protein
VQRPSGAPTPTLVAQFSSNYLAGRPVAPGSMLRVGIPAEQLRPMPESV